MSEERILSRYILLFFLLLIAALAYMAFEAQADNPRYLLKSLYGRGMLWQWSSDDPLIYNAAMCRDEVVGWCDSQFAGAYTSVWRYEIIDFANGRTGSIYKADFGCWVWWWEHDYGTDNNPHPSAAYWIECPQIGE